MSYIDRQCAFIACGNRVSNGHGWCSACTRRITAELGNTTWQQDAWARDAVAKVTREWRVATREEQGELYGTHGGTRLGAGHPKGVSSPGSGRRRGSSKG
jgi:hypothetical protein